MSKVTMPLSVYDELKNSHRTAASEVRELNIKVANLEKKLKENAKIVYVAVDNRKDTDRVHYPKLCKLADIDPTAKTPDIVVFNKPLSETMEALTEAELVDLRAQVENLTKSNEALRKDNEKLERKYKSDDLNIAAKEAYNELARIKGALADLRTVVYSFRKRTIFMTKRTKDKLMFLETQLKRLSE